MAGSKDKKKFSPVTTGKGLLTWKRLAYLRCDIPWCNKGEITIHLFPSNPLYHKPIFKDVCGKIILFFHVVISRDLFFLEVQTNIREMWVKSFCKKLHIGCYFAALLELECDCCYTNFLHWSLVWFWIFIVLHVISSRIWIWLVMWHFFLLSSVTK